MNTIQITYRTLLHYTKTITTHICTLHKWTTILSTYRTKSIRIITHLKTLTESLWDTNTVSYLLLFCNTFDVNINDSKLSIWRHHRWFSKSYNWWIYIKNLTSVLVIRRQKLATRCIFWWFDVDKTIFSSTIIWRQIRSILTST